MNVRGGLKLWRLYEALRVSERRVCRVIGQPRTTQRYDKRILDDEEILRAEIVRLTSQYGRYGCRRVTAMLGNQGWLVNHKRVERIWRQEGLKVPQKQPNELDCGSMMARSCDRNQRSPNMSGATTSCRTAPIMV